MRFCPSCLARLQRFLGFFGFGPFARGDVVIVRAPIEVRDEVFDGGGKIYSWDPDDPNNECSQREGMDSLFKLYEGATLRNVVVRYSPNGLEVLGDRVLVENVTWEEVCEDALALGYVGAKIRVRDVIVRDCVFKGGSDKQIQVNNADGVYLYRNRHERGGAGMKISPGGQNVHLWRTQFEGMKHGVRFETDFHLGDGSLAPGGTARVMYYEYKDKPARKQPFRKEPTLPFNPDAR